MGDQAWSLGETRHGALTVVELLKAERCCARRNSKKGVRKQRGKPQQQSPYLNEEHLIRIGECIKNAAKPGMAKHQIILPRKHVISADNQVLLQ